MALPPGFFVGCEKVGSCQCSTGGVGPLSHDGEQGRWFSIPRTRAAATVPSQGSMGGVATHRCQESIASGSRQRPSTRSRWRRAPRRPSIEHWIVAFNDETTTEATVSKVD